MANLKNSKKAIRQIKRRTEINKSRKSRVKTYIRKVEEAISAGDNGAAKDALKAAQPVIVRAAQKGIMHKNTAARKVSRLTARVKSMTPIAS